MEEILKSIKKMIGFEDNYTHFDPDLVIFINSEFATLFQAGVGPTDKAFRISQDGGETWEDFFEGKTNLESVKEYIYLKAKIVFDPPQSGFVMDAYKAKAEELLWRLNIEDDPGYKQNQNEEGD